MRKRGAIRRHVARSIPGIVAQTVDRRYETRLLVCIDAFRRGYATAHHHADLADTRDLMLVALDSGLCREDESARVMVDFAGDALTNILERHQDLGRWGATGDEIAALQVLADTSLDFWSRRSGALHAHAYSELRTIRQAQAAKLKD